MSFRDAYKKVSEIIESGKFSIPDNAQYTHEGSIGNLQNGKIMERLDADREFFMSQAGFIKKKFSELAS